MEDLQYWVALSQVPGMGTARFRLLERAFRSMAEAWRASPSDLQGAGLDGKTAQALIEGRGHIDPQQESAKLADMGILALTWHDRQYPARLKEIYDPPPVLYLRGELLLEDERAVAVVGTRRATAYGREACAALVKDLVGAGITVISGLARGIDAVAHRAALEAGGRTLAVLGSGLDVVYPPEHKALAQEVAARGAVISEHPPGTRPEARHFPRRNRIISGMSLGVLVAEAPEDSGALWTVHWALEQGRDVFAVPGSVFSPGSRGTNRLIQDGAKLVLEVKDILEELNLASVVAVQPPLPSLLPKLDDARGQVLASLGHEPLHIDEVRRRTSLPIATVSSALAMMEIEGLVKQVGTMHYIRARELPADYSTAR
ncbi:MAG: DNA-protecting protein DprA [Chloroflexi bacterium]|nr:DNA-protecting protein DprA [Chloroflexota bacterium]